MAKKRITIVPNLDTSAPSVKNEGKCRFRIMVRINGVAKPYRTDLFMHREFWVHETEKDPKTGEIRETRKMRIKHGKGNTDSAQLEMDLNSELAEMSAIIKKRESAKQSVTHSTLKGLWERRDDQGDMFLDFARHQIEKLRVLVKRNKRSKGTLTRWKSFAKFVEEFDHDVTFEDISIHWLNRFYFWLAYERKGGYRKRNQDQGLGMSANTIDNAFTWMGNMFKKARKLGITECDNPIAAYRQEDEGKENLRVGPIDRRALLWNEVNILHEAYVNKSILEHPAFPPYERAKLHDCLQHYLAAIYTGLRYSDLKSMHDLSNIEFTGTHLSKIMVKTKRRITLWVSEPLREVIDFEGIMERGFLFNSPVQSPSAANKNLRRLLGAYGVEGYYQMHDLRRTFASVMQNAGVDIYKVSKLLGHASVEETKKYVLTSDAALDDAMGIWDRISNEKQQRVTPDWLIEQLIKLKAINPGLKLTNELAQLLENEGGKLSVA